MTQSRRSVLQLSAVTLASLTGCAMSPPTRKETSSTERPQKLPQLTFEAEVLEQTSVDSPAQVETLLSNEGSNEVDVGYGPTLLFTDNSASEDLDWSNHIVIDPGTSVGPWKAPIRTNDHCWRYPTNATRPVESSLEWRTLGAGESISETYEVYTDSDANTCLPGGAHRFQDRKYVTTESRPMVVTLVLEIDDEGGLVASTEEPNIGATNSG